jgi:hypothetical protein
MVVAGIVPVHLMAKSRAQLQSLQRNNSENANRHIVDNLVWGWWQQEWEELTITGQWTMRCLSCGDPEDDAEHTFFRCGRWANKCRVLEATVGEDVTPETIIPIMLTSREKWAVVERYVKEILTTKEEEEFQRNTNAA